jgi:hypothetical protein
LESFIEINDIFVIHFEEWIYDAILNRTIKEFEDDNLLDFADFFNSGKREQNGYLSLFELDKNSFKKVARYMRRAYYKSQPRRTGLYSRKAHQLYLKEFKDFIGLLYKDDRYQN